MNIPAPLPVLLLLLAVCYAGVLLAILADLVAGLLRARRCGRPLTSGGLRRTVDKLTSYFTALFALTVVDSMIVAASLGLSACGATSFPPFPYLTTLGAIGICLIEVKSIMESSAHKIDLHQAARTLRNLLTYWKVW